MTTPMNRVRRAALVCVLIPVGAGAQVTALPDTVVPSLAPKNPLPSEAATARVTKFSFIAYGDTRD